VKLNQGWFSFLFFSFFFFVHLVVAVGVVVVEDREAWKIHCQGDTESYSDGCFDRAGDEAGDDGATWTTSTPYPL